MPRLFLLISIFAVAAAAQASNSHSQLMDSLRSKDHASAVGELRAVAERDRSGFSEMNYDYLLARLCERAGDLDCAAANYAAVAARPSSTLRGYALWRLGHIARSTGNLLAERSYLARLLAEMPHSLLAEAAEQRMARSWFDSGEYPLAIQHLNRGGGGAKPADRAEQVLLAKAHLYNDDPGTARIIFESLIGSDRSPAQPDDHALEAARALDLIDVGAAEFGRKIGELSDTEHLRRAHVYHYNRDFASARLHFTAVVERNRSDAAADAMLQIGRGHSQSGQYAEAIQWFERAVEQFPAHTVAKDALLQLASAYTRLGRQKEAVARYERYIERYPDDDRVDRAYLNIVDALRDGGEEIEALNWIARTQDRFRGKPAEAQALFARARIRIAQSDWQGSLTDLEALSALPLSARANAPGEATSEEVVFLRGYVNEQMRRLPEAVDLYLSLPDGWNAYYGWRATERLRALAASPEAAAGIDRKREELRGKGRTPDERRRSLQSAYRLAGENDRAALLEELRGVYGSIPAYHIPPPASVKEPSPGRRTAASDLAALELYDEAAAEIEAVSAGSPDAIHLVAAAYLKGDRADRAAAFIERHVKLPSDFQPELLPEHVTEMLYPTPYTEVLRREAAPRGVDPRFVLSVMRQESRFRPNVKSNAAARGLMQFIAPTAERIAADLEVESFHQDELFDPAIAIRFGSRYIEELFVMFPNQPEAVAASYNGGEENMKRWMGRSRSTEADRYVPEILFAQSKDYVHRVMANYRMYGLLYDEGLNSK